ncbi:MAG: hypothetical protein R2682_01900 [Pyrinomonadaceae bacterium]
MAGTKSAVRVGGGGPIELIVRGVDNNSDPLSFVTIYKFKVNKKKRTAYLGRDNTGTLLKSKTDSTAMMKFTGKKFGTSSYLITLEGLEPGEYGVVVDNPNSRDEKKTTVSCFGID